MNIDGARSCCEAHPGATIDHPWGPEDRVYKVGGKAFAFLPESPPWHISLKCDPELVRILRERYAAVTSPRYLNKQLWNRIALDGSMPTDEIEELIAHSYELVSAKLPKALRAQLSPPGAVISGRGAHPASLPARDKGKRTGAGRRQAESRTRRANG
jgi:predicted DNA-binding protein (MmcQ/YjbR family)